MLYVLYIWCLYRCELVFIHSLMGSAASFFWKKKRKTQKNKHISNFSIFNFNYHSNKSTKFLLTSIVAQLRSNMFKVLKVILVEVRYFQNTLESTRSKINSEFQSSHWMYYSGKKKSLDSTLFCYFSWCSAFPWFQQCWHWFERTGCIFYFIIYFYCYS